MSLLSVRGLTKEFGGLAALTDVDVTVEEGEIHGLIGPNGAGKTTMFNLVTGVLEPTFGVIELDGKSTVGKRPHQITRAGVARTFQNIRLFGAMTALENVMVGLDAHHKTGILGAIVRSSTCRREEREGEERAFDLLEQVGITRLANQTARNLSYGDQRRVEIARALATGPKLLLLDEPTAGMNPVEKASLIDVVRRIRSSGITILLIEHDMKVVMGVCDPITVLDFGQKIAEGTPEEVRGNQRVVEAYLGTGAGK